MIRPMSTWLREHREIADLLLLLPLAVVSLLSTHGYTRLGFSVQATLSLMLLLPLIVRRRWPLVVFTFIALICFAQWTVTDRSVAADLAVLIAMYTVAAESSVFWSIAAAGVCCLGALLALYGHGRAWNGWDFERANLIAIGTLVGGIWIFGIYNSTRKAYLEGLEERADRVERERDNQVQLAMAAERARIARELHDVVAHNVSVMVVQADGGAFMIDTEPKRARQALETISETGRTALKEMRLLLGVLRDDGSAGSYAPQPGIEQLPDLIEQTQAAGLPVSFGTEGRVLPLSTGQQLTVYRIVQEALTNAMKHAGPAASAEVRLGYFGNRIEVRVSDDGRGSAAQTDGLGHGLAGMRERVAMYGGRVRALPMPTGFEVVAELPFRGDR
jgi:signal transduction histidine kinase